MIVLSNNSYCQWINPPGIVSLLHPLDFVGIGTPTPAFKLDVNADINAGGAAPATTNSYHLGTKQVLWHNGDPSSIFVGVGAGISTPASSTLYNTLIGNNAGASIIGAQYNTALGYQALYTDANPGMNTAIGYQALYSVHSFCGSCINGNTYNTAVGYQALYNSDAYGGCALGFHAGYSNTFGCSIIAVGEEAAYANTEGNDNVAVGEAALRNNTTLSDNIAIGTAALGGQNYGPLAVGVCPINAGGQQTYGCISSYNVAVGNDALLITNPNSYVGTSLTNGMDNTAIGQAAGASNKLGFDNSFLGFKADVDPSTSGIFNATSIGANATVMTSNTMILGNNLVQVGIGFSSNPIGPQATLDVYRGVSSPSVPLPIGAQVYNSDVAIGFSQSDGINVITDGNNGTNFGGNFHATNAANNYAGNFKADNSANQNYGIQSIAYDATKNIGVLGYANASSYSGMYGGSSNFGGLFNATSNDVGAWDFGGQFQASSTDATTTCYGVHARALGNPISTNIGVYGQAPPTALGNNWGGWFTGQIMVGTIVYPSDASLKLNVDTIPLAINIIKALKPHIYHFDTAQYPYMNLSSSLQYGLLSNEVAQVLPSLVVDATQPAQYDTAHNQISPSKSFKGLQYIEIVPILIQGMKTQQNMIDTLISQNSMMKTNIDSLWNALNNCCSKNNPAQQNIAPPQNKDGGNINGNSGSGNEKKLDNGNIHAIELSNASGSPIIYQNQPNPFNSGGTKIRYFVPDNTNSPQIVFFDEFGGKLSTFNILETGMGELDVTASNLSSGVYSYSLIINGKAIDTKKMIFQK